MGSAGEGMKCEGGFFATVSSGDAVKNSEQISRGWRQGLAIVKSSVTVVQR